MDGVSSVVEGVLRGDGRRGGGVKRDCIREKVYGSRVTYFSLILYLGRLRGKVGG